jgi:hypothetical protein
MVYLAEVSDHRIGPAEVTTGRGTAGTVEDS